MVDITIYKHQLKSYIVSESVKGTEFLTREMDTVTGQITVATEGVPEIEELMKQSGLEVYVKG